MKRNFYKKPDREPLTFCYCAGKPKICYTRERAYAERNKTGKRDLTLRLYHCVAKASANKDVWHLTSQPPRLPRRK